MSNRSKKQLIARQQFRERRAPGSWAELSVWASRRTGGLLIGFFLIFLSACGSIGGPTPTPTFPVPPTPDIPTPTAVPTRDPSDPPGIAYMSNRDGPFDVFIMDNIGNNVINLTENTATDGVPTNAGTGISFLTDRDQGVLAFYLIDYSGGNLIKLISDPTPGVGELHWSPDRSQAAYVSGPEDTQDIYLFDRATGEITNLTESTGKDEFGDWAPDGSQLLFSSNRDGRRSIYKLELNSGSLVRLTEPDVNSTYPAWSPDGQQIAFASDRDQDVEIYVMAADGSSVLRMTNAPEFDGYPKWSPDGQKIAFLSYRAANADIFSMNADGSEQVNLTRTVAEESPNGEFSWSPDGSQILFFSRRDGNPDIYTMNADGSDPLNLTFFPADDISPVWVY